MKNSEILSAAFFLIECLIICYFFYVYLNNHKKNKVEREIQLKELQNLILNKITETAKQQEVKNTENKNNQEIKLKEISKQLQEKFEQLGKDVKIFQEQANSKINLGFEQLQKENSNIQSEVNNKIADIKNSFNDYSQNVEKLLTKFSNENYNTKLEANKLKEEMQQDLKNIMLEIKAPLDLD